MAKKKSRTSSRKQKKSESVCCNVESIIGMDQKGQLLLPKDVRKKIKIQPGEKVAVVSWRKDDDVCCIVLMKADNLSGGVKNVLSPILRESPSENEESEDDE